MWLVSATNPNDFQTPNLRSVTTFTALTDDRLSQAAWIMRVLVTSILLWFGCGLTSAAETPNFPEEVKVVELREQFLMKQALREHLQFRRELSETLKSHREVADRLLTDTARAVGLASQVADAVQKSNQEQLEALQTLVTSLKKRRDEAEARYRDLSSTDLGLESRWREAEEMAHLRRDSVLAWSQVLASMSRQWCTLLIVAMVSLTLWWHDRRRGFRQWLRSRAVAREPIATALWWAAGIAVTCQGCGTPLPPLSIRPQWEAERRASLEKEKQALVSDLAKLDVEMAELERTVTILENETNREEASDRLATDTNREIESSQKTHQRQVEQLSHQVASLQFEISAFERSSETLATSVQKTTEQIRQFQSRLPSQSRRMKQTEVGVVFALAGLFLLPLQLSVWKHWRESRKHRRTCPRCLTEDQLKPLGDGKRTLKLVCNAEIKKGQKCAAEFPPDVQRRSRLCFPTVGIINSGKTKWIRSVEKQFERDMTEGHAHISLVTPSNAGKVHTSTKADEVPMPIVLRLRDRDVVPPRGQTLLMLFDYGGEMGKRTVTDSPKKRALFMDGFVLFLDPTRTRGKKDPSGKSLNIDDQIENARHFKEDLKAASDKVRGDRLEMPVAVCISKLDLLVNMNPLGGRAFEFLDKLRETQDEPITLDLIQRRSQLCTTYLRQMFDGWNIEQFLRTNFGQRYMFFPLTPVNINQEELGQTDVNDDVEKRTAFPFGVQEPIWWLLHMYGYKVLTTEATT